MPRRHPVYAESQNHEFEAEATVSFYTKDLRVAALLRVGVFLGLPIGSKVVPLWGSYLEPYKAIPNRNYYGAYG